MIRMALWSIITQQSIQKRTSHDQVPIMIWTSKNFSGENRFAFFQTSSRRKLRSSTWFWFIFFFSVIVISAFTLCYLPGFICILLTVKLGPARVPNALRHSVIMLTAVNSALNPIIYMFRSNEFRIIFKRLCRGTSTAPLPTEGKEKARAARSRLQVSTCNQQASFPTVLTGDVASSEVDSAVEVTEANLP